MALETSKSTEVYRIYVESTKQVFTKGNYLFLWKRIIEEFNSLLTKEYRQIYAMCLALSNCHVWNNRSKISCAIILQNMMCIGTYTWNHYWASPSLCWSQSCLAFLSKSDIAPNRKIMLIIVTKGSTEKQNRSTSETDLVNYPKSLMPVVGDV